MTREEELEQLLKEALNNKFEWRRRARVFLGMKYTYTSEIDRLNWIKVNKMYTKWKETPEEIREKFLEEMSANMKNLGLYSKDKGLPVYYIVDRWRYTFKHWSDEHYSTKKERETAQEA